MEFNVSSKNLAFLNTEGKLSDSNIVILGIPLDCTATFRVGTKLAPDSIRLASHDIESYDIFHDLDVEDIKICDIGDVDIVPGNIHKNFEKILEVTRELRSHNKTLIALGGEHSITYPITKSYDNDLIIHFDAHADLREEYLGEKWTHASVMKRILDERKHIHILNLGLRALSRQEMDEIKREDRFHYIDTYRILKEPINSIIREVREQSKEYRKIHISIDLDVLDPSSCPGISNPEPGGISYWLLKNLLTLGLKPINKNITSIDIVELNPLFDKIYSPFVAAKIIFDVLAILNSSLS
ncbi:MAG: agmatinase [Candidatus Helarchaeota archaeon]